MRVTLVGGLVVGLGCAGCMGTATAEDDEPRGVRMVPPSGVAGAGGSGAQQAPQEFPEPDPADELGAECDDTRSVDPHSETLLVSDPELLKGFTLERVAAQIAATSQLPHTALQLVQRLFDTNNSSADGAFPDVVHCDSEQHPVSATPSAGNCTRAEGRLARSPHLFES